MNLKNKKYLINLRKHYIINKINKRQDRNGRNNTQRGYRVDPTARDIGSNHKRRDREWESGGENNENNCG